MTAYRTILVGTDGSETSLRAVARAAAIARDSDATLVLVSAYEPERKGTVAEAELALGSEGWEIHGSAPAESNLSIARDHAAKAGVSKIETHALEGQPVKVLTDLCDKVHADLVVVGNVGLNTLSGRVLGSVATGVARKTGVDVLVVHTS
jgi:nucleotide-binding universal stress UspA family protein